MPHKAQLNTLNDLLATSLFKRSHDADTNGAWDEPDFLEEISDLCRTLRLDEQIVRQRLKEAEMVVIDLSNLRELASEVAREIVSWFLGYNFGIGVAIDLLGLTGIKANTDFRSLACYGLKLDGLKRLDLEQASSPLADVFRCGFCVPIGVPAYIRLT